MKRRVLVFFALMLAVMLPQCRKPQFSVLNESYSQEITFNNDDGDGKGDLTDNITSMIYDWDESNDCLYVYCLDGDKHGMSYAGKLGIVPGSINGSKASFWGRVKINKKSEYFRFYHFGSEVVFDESGHTATSDLSVQNGLLAESGKNSSISGNVVAYADFKINNECEYNGKLSLLFTVMKLNLVDFTDTEGDVKVSGMTGNRLNISGTGELSLDFAGEDRCISLDGVTSSSDNYYVAIPIEIAGGSKGTPDMRINFHNDVRETYIPINTASAHFYTGDEGAAYRFTYFYPKGALPGKFSVGVGKQVFFSQGNLQWTPDGTHDVAIGGTLEGVWRFAEHQWDCIGKGNEDIYGEGTASGDEITPILYNNAPVSGCYMDLFGFATSGYYNPPYAYGGNSAAYIKPGDEITDISKTNYDWGYYNSIFNGGDMPKRWRALTNVEWVYLATGRNNNSAYNSNGGYFMAGTGTLKLSDGKTEEGLFILPDDYYTKPEHKNFLVGKGWSLTEQELNDYQIFFSPCGGFRNGGSTNDVGDLGYFHASDAINTIGLFEEAYNPAAEGSIVFSLYHERRHFGFFVRLVRDVNLGVASNYD